MESSDMEAQGAECKALGHQTRVVPCKKRGFSCAKCGQHVTKARVLRVGLGASPRLNSTFLPS